MNEAFHTVWVHKQLQHWHWRPWQSWRLPGARPVPPGTQWHRSPGLPRWLLLTSHELQQRGCPSPPEGSPGQGTANSHTSLQPPPHAISPSLNIIPQNLPFHSHDGARMWENRLKPLPSRRNPMPSSLQPLPGVRDVKRRGCTAFTGVTFLQGLNTCVIHAVLASLRLVLLRLSLLLAKKQNFY